VLLKHLHFQLFWELAVGAVDLGEHDIKSDKDNRADGIGNNLTYDIEKLLEVLVSLFVKAVDQVGFCLVCPLGTSCKHVDSKHGQEGEDAKVFDLGLVDHQHLAVALHQVELPAGFIVQPIDHVPSEVSFDEILHEFLEVAHLHFYPSTLKILLLAQRK
jgi:hypothetical protein